MRILVCGGRDFSATNAFNWLQSNLKDEVSHATGCAIWSLSAIIHGGARGADEGAAAFGASENVKVLRFDADWKRFGRSAGHIRNMKMLREGKPDVVLAFPGGRGTANMIMQATDAGVKVIRVRNEWSAQ